MVSTSNTSNTLTHLTIHHPSDAMFEQLFKAYFKPLHTYAYTIIRDEIMAEEIVQNLFLKLWEKKADLSVHTSLRAFLYRSVYHESLNYVKHQKVKLKFQQHQAYAMQNENNDTASNRVHLRELQIRLQEALNRLPEGCRTVFQMSRFEELKYREIAERLNISVKTVENQMGKALKVLRTNLADFLPLLLFLAHFCITRGVFR